MEYIRLGRSGLTVSRLCLGTMNFGKTTSEEESCRIMNLAVDSGIVLFDTADVYGGEKGKGVTEQIVGRWFSHSRTNREKVILATKVYGVTGDGPNDARLSAYHLTKACEDSLRRLKTDRIDLYQMHHVDRETTWDEIWQAMEKLVRDGKVLYIGSCNFAAWHIAKANENARNRHFLGLVSEQSIYNLCIRTVELEVLPACRDYGLGFLAWSPLNGGMLAINSNKIVPSRAETRAKLPNYAGQLRRWADFCSDLGEPPDHIAVAWLLRNSLVTSVIVGPSTASQLESSLEALKTKLDEQAIQRLEHIWPGTGGPAPEAYAW